METFLRTQMLLGEKALERIKSAHIAVFGIGGVGSYTAEALARAGVGELTLIDSDTVACSNINRQLVALSSTIGERKVDVMKARILDINPKAVVHTYPVFFSEEKKDIFSFSSFDYVADAVDTVTAKISIIQCAKEAEVPVISCMGAGNKLDPTAFLVADIEKTSVCPLAKVMRHELRKKGIKKVKVVYSKELPVVVESNEAALLENPRKRQVPGSISFVPSVAGLILAGEIIKDIAKK